MASPSLACKIKSQERLAPLLLPQARLCADVVLSFLAGDEEIEGAVTALKHGLGASWHIVRAFQFLSGRQGMLAADASPSDDERMRLRFACELANHIGNSNAITRADLAHLRAVAVTAAANIRLQASHQCGN